jgi:hypothetical protein
MLFIIDPTSSDDTFIVWYQYNSTETIDRTSASIRYRMFEAGSWDDTAAPYFETQVYELRDNNGQPNKIQWVQWLFSWFSSSDVINNIRVYYRFNNASSYALLWTIWNDWIDVNKILRWIGKRVHTIQFKILMWDETTSATWVRNTKLTWLRLF